MTIQHLEQLGSYDEFRAEQEQSGSSTEYSEYSTLLAGLREARRIELGISDADLHAQRFPVEQNS